MKKMVALIMAMILIMSLFACADTSIGKPTGPATPGANAVTALDGKKVIFVGCSYTYYGNTVHRGGMYQDSQNKFFAQEERSNDQGFFYQLCKANGAEVAVTDWTYGGHDLTDLFDGECNAERGHDGHDHVADLVDRAFDYVILQEIQPPGTWSAEKYLDNVKGIMEFFRAANPDVKFYYAVHDGVYTQNYRPGWKKSVEMIRQEGVTIIDWGTLVWDVWNGTEEVSDAAQTYNKNSFIVSRVAGDGYHPNPLSAYINSLMTYCAITGETAVGQPYSFCTEDALALERFVRSYYKWDDPKTENDERETNFIEILSSETDIKGLQILADQYLAAGSRLCSGYTVVFKNEDGTVIKETPVQYGDNVAAPVAAPQKPGDASGEYVFVGWDKEIVRCAGNAEYIAVFEKK